MQFDKKNPVYVSLKALAKQSKKIQKIVGGAYSNSELCFLQEFCTVKVCTARRSGHTNAIAMFAIEKMLKGKKVLVLNWSMEQSKTISTCIASSCKEEKVQVDRVTATEVQANGGHILLGSKGQKLHDFGSLRGHAFDYILVDIASMWSKKEVKSLYRNLGPCLMQTKYPIIAFLE